MRICCMDCVSLSAIIIIVYTFDPSVVPVPKGAIGGRRWVGVHRVTCVEGGADNNYFYITFILENIFNLFCIQSNPMSMCSDGRR